MSDETNHNSSQSASSSSPRIGDTRPAPQIGDTRPASRAAARPERCTGGQSSSSRRPRSRRPGQREGATNERSRPFATSSAPSRRPRPTPVVLDGASRQGTASSRGRTSQPRPGALPHVRAHDQGRDPHRHPRGSLDGRVHGRQGRRRDQPDRRQHLPRSNPERPARHGTRLRRHRHSQERRVVSR